MDHIGSHLLILSLGNPHRLESRQRCQDGPTDPHQELPFRRGNHPNLHSTGSQSDHLLGQPFGDAWEHSTTARHHDISVEVFSDVNIAFHDGLVGDLVEAGHLFGDFLFAKVGRLEKSLWTSEALVAD